MIFFVYRVFSPYLSLYFVSRGAGLDSIGVYREALRFVFTLLNIYLIYSSVQLGRKFELEVRYKHVIGQFGRNWLLSFLLFIPLYFLLGEEWRSIVWSGLTIHFTSGYVVGAKMFSAISLGWLVERRLPMKLGWSREILKPVLVYYGIQFLTASARHIMFYRMVESGYSRSGFSQVSAYTSMLMSVIYPLFLYRMLSAGRKINLEEDYPSVLYTLLVPKLVNRITSDGVHTVVMYILEPKVSVLLDFLYDTIIEFVNTPISLMGLVFGLICYNYLNSKYRYKSTLNSKSNSTADRDSGLNSLYDFFLSE